jgi:hypothetical protein
VSLAVGTMVMSGILERDPGSRVVVTAGLEKRSRRRALKLYQEASSPSVERKEVSRVAHRS